MKKLAVLTAFAGCKEQAAQKPPVDQSRICVYSNDEEAQKCVNGELSFFNPTRWGNEQLPLFVVAQYCDTNYNITYTMPASFVYLPTKECKSLPPAANRP